MRRRAACLLAVHLLVGLAPAAAADLSEAARWLQGYLAIDTTNPPGGEHRAAAYLAAILHREGIPTRLYVTAEGRTSLYARLEAERPTAGALLLTHHMDVVPAGPGWSVDPFAGTVEERRLWGRGAVDAKSLGVAHLAAFVDLKRRRLPLTRDVAFLAVPDEEVGGGQGMAWLFAHHPEVFDGVTAVLNEGGSARVGAGSRLLWWEVEVAQKRPLWLEVRARGRAGHASGHNPKSAVHKLVAALGRVVELPRRYRASPPARTYLAALAPLHRGRTAQAFAAIDDYLGADGPTVPLMPGVANLLLDTVQVTVLEASDSINVIPTAARARIDVRLLPDTDAAAMLERLTAALGEEVALEVLLTAPPAPASPLDDPVYRALAAVLGRSAPVVPAMISGFTDSRHFRERGIPAYGIVPFALEYEDRRGIHASDERIPAAELDRGVERMRAIVRACAAGAG